MKRSLIIMAASFALAGVFAAATLADSPGVSQGDAEAVYNAIGGRGAIVLHSPTLEGAPDTQLVRISPFGAIGRHYCSLDWHVVGLNLGEIGPRQVAAAGLAPFVVRIFVDGELLDFTPGALKRADPQSSLIMFGSSDVFFRAYGAVVAPDALGVGAHTVSVVAVDTADGTGSFEATNPFFIDAPGAGACG
jgi:hypothetical protein